MYIRDVRNSGKSASADLFEIAEAHRLHDNKREVIVYDYVDGCVPLLSVVYSKSVRGYEAVGYIVQDQ
ncbi:MAG: hypothetical protein IPK15_23640 [Verrucomicrobia bacterium]|nr:hypothetical protein [Verrucomicrobiota bacterium]